MVKRFLKLFKNGFTMNGEKGFTLIELLVVISILGVLAAVAVPNVAMFMGYGQKQARGQELGNVRVAVYAAMGYAGASKISGATVAGTTFSKTADIACAAGSGTSTTIGAMIQGGNAALAYSYKVFNDGMVTQDP